MNNLLFLLILLMLWSVLGLSMQAQHIFFQKTSINNLSLLSLSTDSLFFETKSIFGRLNAEQTGQPNFFDSKDNENKETQQCIAPAPYHKSPLKYALIPPTFYADTHNAFFCRTERKIAKKFVMPIIFRLK